MISLTRIRKLWFFFLDAFIKRRRFEEFAHS